MSAAQWAAIAAGSDRDHDRRDRDRDRKHKSSRRSRSRSKDRKSRRKDRSETPPRRRRRERKSGFDIAPGAAGVGIGPAAAVPAPSVEGFTSNGFGNAPPMMGSNPGLSLAAQPPSQQATRHARRVYVGGLPPTGNEQNIATFFSNALAAVGGTTAGPGPSVVNVYINYEKKFAFVEFRTVEETSNAMALDGIMFEGVSVRVRRPNDYNPAAAAALGPAVPNPTLNLLAIGLHPGGMNAGTLIDAAERIFVGGLPYYLTDDQCRELLGSFGAIKSFDLVKDRDTGNSKGYGFVVYQDPTVTDIACAGLNGMRMGERTLTVRRATEQSAPNPAMPEPAAMTSRILSLREAVTVEELQNDEEYNDIVEDMREECGKFGQVNNVIIPRPTAPGTPAPSGLGRVIVEFADDNGCTAAYRVLNGRRFGGRTVVATYLPEQSYQAGQFDI
ncbi:g4628 [Coccomyxa viridis]|uniref:Splicing factor U2af large subunit n=1 Tax=Coccomyxa viridis TaxID=1274662 RepID=A0ABP1FTT4_9CHLO